jgi:hypothetical protein
MSVEQNSTALCELSGCGAVVSLLDGSVVCECPCPAPWSRSPEFVGAYEAPQPCNSNESAIAWIYTVAAVLGVTSVCVQLFISKTRWELLRGSPTICGHLLMVSFAVQRSVFVPPTVEHFFYVDLSFTLRWQLAAALYYTMLGAFLAKYLNFLAKQQMSIGIEMSKRQARLVWMCPKIVAAQVAITLLVLVPISWAATQRDARMRPALLRVGLFIDALVKTLNVVAFTPVILLADREMTQFLRHENESGGARNSAGPQIRRLLAGMRVTRLSNEVYTLITVPPIFLGALFPGLTHGIRYTYPGTYVLGVFFVLVSTITMYRTGARKAARMRSKSKQSLSFSAGESASESKIERRASSDQRRSSELNVASKAASRVARIVGTSSVAPAPH